MNTVHILAASIGEAYDQTQYDDEIKDGDIVVCNGGKTVAILVEAWPTIVKGDHGKIMHELTPGYTWAQLDDGKYLEAYKIAIDL